MFQISIRYPTIGWSYTVRISSTRTNRYNTRTVILHIDAGTPFVHTVVLTPRWGNFVQCFFTNPSLSRHKSGITLDKNRTRFSEKYVFSPPYISGVPLMRAPSLPFATNSDPWLSEPFAPSATAYKLERSHFKWRSQQQKKMHIYIPRPRVQRHPAKKYCTVPNHCIPTYVKSLVPFQIII